jgi:hypothetical protein
MPLLTWQLWLAKDVVTEIRLPTAIVSASIDAGKGCTVNASTFNQYWHSGCCSQTASPFRRMANRKVSHSKMSLSCGQKG